MSGWIELLGAWLVLLALLEVTYVALHGRLAERRGWRVLVRLGRRIRRSHHADVIPLRRPVEKVGADRHRLHDAFHRGGMRFAKYEGCRQAYDRVLAEAADMLELTHLIGLLPPGTDLDRERERVEMQLENAGLLIRPWAA